LEKKGKAGKKKKGPKKSWKTKKKRFPKKPNFTTKYKGLWRGPDKAEKTGRWGQERIVTSGKNAGKIIVCMTEKGEERQKKKKAGNTPTTKQRQRNQAESPAEKSRTRKGSEKLKEEDLSTINGGYENKW